MLVKRSGIYYFRRKVPVALRSHIKRCEFIHSLKTRDLIKAAELAKVYRVYTDEIIRNARMKFDFNNVSTFIRKDKLDENGRITETTKEIDPETIKAMQSCGLTPEQIAEQIMLFLNGPSAPLPQVQSSALNHEVDGESIQSIVNQFQTFTADEREGKPPSDYSTKFRRLIEILGADTLANSLSRDDAIRARNLLKQLPKNARPYSGNVRKIIDAVELEG